MLHVHIKTTIFALFTITNIYSNPPDSIPVAEYCVQYKRKIPCDFCNVSCDSVNAYLRLGKILQKQPDVIVTNLDTIKALNYDLDFKFLINDDLITEQSFLGGKSGCTKNETASGYIDDCTENQSISWFFADDFSICSKNKVLFDFNKYYKKGKIVPVEWILKVKIGGLRNPFYDTTFTGSYNIRITGECKAHGN